MTKTETEEAVGLRMQRLVAEAWSDRLPDGRYFEICNELHGLLSGAQRESLAQLVKYGPVWDGDVVSKATRGELFDLRMASRAIYRGAEGHTVANYFGARVLDPKFDKAWKQREQTLLSNPLDMLTQDELQLRYEIEERHADEVMQRATKTLGELRRRINLASKAGAP